MRCMTPVGCGLPGFDTLKHCPTSIWECQTWRPGDFTDGSMLKPNACLEAAGSQMVIDGFRDSRSTCFHGRFHSKKIPRDRYFPFLSQYFSLPFGCSFLLVSECIHNVSECSTHFPS